jgi:transposase-like protein
MLHRARETMQTRRRRLEGVVEVDEAFIGGKYRNMHVDARRRKPKKAIVLGLLQRGGDVQTRVVRDREKETLHREIKSTVAPGAKLFTDDLRSYNGLKPFYRHRTVNHTGHSYVDGEAYTNNLEGYWSHLKRCIRSTYISVDPHHLPKYLNEQQIRWNTRTLTDGDRFIEALNHVIGKRLTYKKLIKRSTSKPRRGG